MKKNVKRTLLIIFIIIIVVILFISFSLLSGFFALSNTCYYSLRDYNVPNKLMTNEEIQSSSGYAAKNFNPISTDRQFVRYTPFCNQSDKLVKNELVIFKDDSSNEVAAKIISINGDDVLVNTIDGEQLIQKKQIIADD